MYTLLGIVAVFVVLVLIGRSAPKNKPNVPLPSSSENNSSERQSSAPSSSSEIPPLYFTKISDNIFHLPTVRHDAFQGLLGSLGNVMSVQYQTGVLKGKVSDSEFHLICHSDSVAVRRVDVGFTVELVGSEIDLPMIFSNVFYSESAGVFVFKT